MNKKVIELTKKIGEKYVEISKLKAQIEVFNAEMWEAKVEQPKE